MPARIFVTWFTSMIDLVDHAVTDEEFAAHRPEPEAVCGTRMMLAPMTWAPRLHCPRCAAFVHTQRSSQEPEQQDSSGHRAHGLLSRIFGNH